MLHAPGHNTEAAPQQPLQLPALLDARDLAEGMATLLRGHSLTPGQEVPRIRKVREGEAVQSLVDYDPPAPVFFQPLPDGTVRQQPDYTPLVDHEVLQLALVLSRAARSAADGDMQAAQGILTLRIRRWAARFLHLARPRVVHSKQTSGKDADEPLVYAQLSQLLHDTLHADPVANRPATQQPAAALQPTAAQRVGLVRPASAPAGAPQLRNALDTPTESPEKALIASSFGMLSEAYQAAIRATLAPYASAKSTVGVNDSSIAGLNPEMLPATPDICAGLQSAASALADAFNAALAKASFEITVPAPQPPQGGDALLHVFGHYTNEVGVMLAVMEKYQLSPSKSKEVSVLMARWTQARQAAAAAAMMQDPAAKLQPAYAAHFATQLATYQRPGANPFLASQAPHTTSAAVKHLFHTANHLWSALFVPGYIKDYLPDTRPQPADSAPAAARAPAATPQPTPFTIMSSTGQVIQPTSSPRPAAPPPAPAPRSASRSMVPPLVRTQRRSAGGGEQRRSA